MGDGQEEEDGKLAEGGKGARRRIRSHFLGLVKVKGQETMTFRATVFLWEFVFHPFPAIRQLILSTSHSSRNQRFNLGNFW